jgi:TonB-linked SusC/RagA family outer membrane protein
MKEIIKSNLITFKKCNRALKIMKISMLLIFICLFSLTAGNVYPQQTELSLNLRNVTIKNAISEIEKTSDYVFLITDEAQLELNKKTSLRTNKESIYAVLETLLKDTNLGYTVVERQVSVYKSAAPKAVETPMTITEEIEQQKKTITGKIIDERGESVIGATILEKGTTNGTVTDYNGSFSINVDNNAILHVSYTGYLTQEIPVAGRTSFNITLQEDMKILDEVVVVGYGTMKKSDLTGAVGKVTVEELNQLSTTDIGQALAGRVAGVDIIGNSGMPGSGTKIRIRGYGSINNSDPLYVVDGVPLSDIDHISPQDIESLEILKDASATAIYGSRGANGVILIQTKKGGFDKKPTFNVNIYGSMSNIVRTIDVLNAWEFATLKREALVNSGGTVNEIMNAQFNYVIDNKLEGTNWQDEATRTGYSQNYNISVNGGGNRNAYDLGVTYSNEQGITKFNEINSIIVRTNNTYKLTDKIELNTNLVYTHRKREGSGFGGVNYYGGLWPSILSADPLTPAYDYYTNNYGEIVYSDVSYHPARQLIEGSSKYNSNKTNMFSGNVSLQINDILTKGLSFRTQYGIRGMYDDRLSYSPIYFIASNQTRQRSSLSVAKPNNDSWLWNAYLSYAKIVTEKHNISATLGTELQKRSSYTFTASANDIPEKRNMWYLSQTGDPTSYSASNSASFNALASFFARVNYSYAGKYLFTGTVRADGSSKFLDKWGYFPSFSLGWNLNEESFMKDDVDWISQLKVRVGWGQVGNEASAGNDDYIALMTANTGYNYVFGGIIHPGTVQQAYANKSLSWEAAEQLNFGLDFGVINMKLHGTIDYFIRTTRDMILATPIPQYAGMWRARTNAGEMVNRGLEVTLKWQDKIGDFSYALSGNMSFVKNEVLNLGSPDPIYGSNIGRIQEPFTRTEVGREMAYFYGYKTDGIFQTQAEVDNYTYTDENGQLQPLQPLAKPGDVKFVKLSDDGQAINANDRTYLGSGMPDVTYGFNVNLKYKNVDFLIFLQGVAGNEIANAKVQDLYSTNMLQWNMSKDMMNRWTPANPSNEYPRLDATDPNHNVRFSDRYIEDGTYLRIKNIQIGYNFSGQLIQRINLSRLRLYASVDNLWVFTKYRGFDPEMGDYLGNPLDMGIDMGSYPRPRTISFGLNLTF